MVYSHRRSRSASISNTHNYVQHVIIIPIITVPPMTSITTIDDGLNYVYNKPTISCQSNIVNSKPTFVWFKNGVAINSTWDGYKISGDYFKSYLTLQNYPSNQHDGVYNCTAINVAGKSTASIAVTVQGINNEMLVH